MPSINIEVQAQVEQAIRDLGRTTKGVDLMGKANQDAAGALGVFGVSLTGLGNPLTAVASLTKAAIDTTVKWGDTIDELSRITGTSAEDTSKLAIVMGNLGVSTDTLKGAAKALKDEGLTPNLDTLKMLSNEYQAIQDPAERTRWGTERLGKAYFELSEILDQPPGKLDALAAAAERSGKVMDEQGIQKAEDFAIKTRQLQDAMDGLLIKVGGPVIDTLTAAGTTLQNEANILEALKIKWDLATGAIDQATASQRAATLVGYDAAAEIQARTDTHIAMAVATHNSWMEVQGHTGAVMADTAAQQGAAPVWQAAIAQLGVGSLALKDQIFLQDQLRLAAGLTTQEEINQRLAVEHLAAMMRGGKITQEEYVLAVQAVANGATSAKTAIAQMGDSVNNLPGFKRIEIQTAFTQTGTPSPGSATPMQHGGVVPPGFPNDTFPALLSSGERVIPAGSTTNHNMGGVTINIIGDPRTIQRELAKAGLVADTRRRMA